jgi:predicted outer membrane repeat protein
MRHRICTLLCLMFTALPLSTRADDFCVGRSGAFTTHGNLPAALAAAAANGSGLDTIRLDTITFAVPDNLLIQGHAVDIIGGFEFCQPLAPTGISIIDGSGGQAASVITFLNSGGTRRSSLDRVTIIGGSGNANGGGIVVSGPGLTVVLNPGVLVHSNISANGGGVAVLNEAQLQLRGAVIRNNNATSQGGGVYCSDSVLDVDSATSIRSNFAPNGGGLSLRTLCAAKFTGGSVASVASNTAGSVGGGILAADNASVVVNRADGAGAPIGRSGAFQIRNNGAALHGAGIALISGASLTASGIVLTDNTLTAAAGAADNPTGAALYAGANASVIIRADPRCASNEACNLISGNVISNASVLPSGGAGIAALQAASIDVGQVEIASNGIASGASVASAIHIDDTTAFFLERALIHHNGPVNAASSSGVIALENVASTRLHYLTLVDNTVSSGALSRVIRAGSLGTIAWRSSIVDQPGTALLSAISGVPAVFDCILANEISTLPNPTRSLADTPAYVDRGQRNYRAAPGALQIDYCDGPPATVAGVALTDLDLAPAPRDVITVDLHGPHDLGAYESQQPQVDAVFGDGFE